MDKAMKNAPFLKPLSESEKVAKPCNVCGTPRPFHKKNEAGVEGWNTCQIHKDAPAILADNARLREMCGELVTALDDLQACSSSVVAAHGYSFKNSLAIDLNGAIRRAVEKIVTYREGKA